MGEKKGILELACAHVGANIEQVLAHQVFEDYIAFVVEAGHEYQILLADLEEPADVPVEAEAAFIEAEPKAEPEPEPKPEPEPEPKPELKSEPKPKSKRVDATPGAKRLAREHNVDLTTIQGSGQGGRIVKADVEAVL